MNYSKSLIKLIGVSTICRLLIAALLYFGVDEVYYRGYANGLQINYFDHPPMVALLIKVTTLNLLLDNELFVRLGPVLLAAINTFMIFKCGELLRNQRTGYFAALFYTANIFTSVISGIFILPDAPHLFFWLAALFTALVISRQKEINRKSKTLLLLFAVLSGLAFLSKVYAIFIWIGFILYIFTVSKDWLRNKTFYFAMLLASLFLLPVLVWNVQNDFITSKFHGARVDVSSSAFSLDNFIQFNLGQFGYQNPIIFVGYCIALVALFQNKISIGAKQKWLLIYTALPLVILAIFISLFKQVLPHWTGPSSISLILILSLWLEQKESTHKANLPKMVKASMVLLCTALLFGLGIIFFYPGTIGSKEKLNFASGDFTADMHGWRQIRTEFGKIAANYPNTNIVLSRGWLPSAHLEHYVAKPLNLQLFALGNIQEIHQYHWWNKKTPIPANRFSAFLILPSNYNCDLADLPQLKDAKVEQQFEIPIYRSNKQSQVYRVFLLKNIDPATINQRENQSIELSYSK